MYVNMKDFKNIEALNKEFGRGEWMYVGRPHRKFPGIHSALANPFPVANEADRDKVVEQYRAWLWERIKSKDPLVLEALREAHGKVLVCWCAPLRCHAEVVGRAAAYCRLNGLV